MTGSIWPFEKMSKGELALKHYPTDAFENISEEELWTKDKNAFVYSNEAGSLTPRRLRNSTKCIAMGRNSGEHEESLQENWLICQPSTYLFYATTFI
jgi:hypothetical protein